MNDENNNCTNKVSIFKKHSDMNKPKEDVYEIKLESMTESVDDLLLKAKNYLDGV